MIGLALLAVGAVCLWAAFTGRATNVLAALKMQLPTVGAGNTIVPTPTTGNSDGSSSPTDTSSSTDIGSHSAMTAGGLVYVINKAYADMTDSEKADANNYAHQINNLGST